MKRKSVIFLLGMILTLALTGCQSDTRETEKATEKATEKTAAATEAPETEADTAGDADTEADTDDASEADDADAEADDTDADADDADDADADADDADGTNADDANTEDADADGTEDADLDAEASLSADEDTSDEEASDEESASLAPITPSDYLIADASEYVTLGSYDGMEVQQVTYEITDDMVDERIEEELEMYAEEVEEDRPSQEDDTVYMDLTYSVQGTDEKYSEEEFYTIVGYEEFGPEFDEYMTGVSAGDSLSFSITYDEDDMIADWEGKTVDFTAEILSVCCWSVPEYDDTFVTEDAGYESKADYEAALRETLALEYENMSYNDVIDSLFSEALARTEISGYPQDLYDSCKEENLSFYLSFIEDGTEEDVYEMFGLSEEDMEAEILSLVNRRLLVSAYCEANDITVTEDEYVSYVEEYAYYYGEEDPAAFEEVYTRESLVWSLYESKFAEDLYGKAEITEISSDEAIDDDYIIEEIDEDEEAVLEEDDDSDELPDANVIEEETEE